MCVQVSQAKSSTGMELKGFQQGLDYLLKEKVNVQVVTTDRSPSIRKIMPVSHPQIQHEFDVWHVAKGMILGSIIQLCVHMYKSVINHG